MSLRLTLDLKGQRRLARTIKAMSPDQVPEFKKKALRRTAFRVQETAQTETIARGRPVDAPPLPDMLTSRRGGRGLVGTIGTDFSGLPDRAVVQATARYAAVHEFGLGVYPRRAFLQPALERNADFMVDAFGTAWQAQLDDA